MPCCTSMLTRLMVAFGEVGLACATPFRFASDLLPGFLTGVAVSSPAFCADAFWVKAGTAHISVQNDTATIIRRRRASGFLLDISPHFLTRQISRIDLNDTQLAVSVMRV